MMSIISSIRKVHAIAKSRRVGCYIFTSENVPFNNNKCCLATSVSTNVHNDI